MSHLLILTEDYLHYSFEALKQAMFEFRESKSGPQYFQQSKNSLVLCSLGGLPDFPQTFPETFTFVLSPVIKSVTSTEL